MPAAGRVAIMFLLKQNQLLENRNYTFHLEVERLKSELERLKTLELEVAELRERLGQNSQNSSKPPSSDPPSVSRPNKRQPSGRKRGGQRGHQGHGRTLLPPDQVDHIVELRPVSCQQCSSLLMGDDPAPARWQVSELPPVRARVTEYRQHTLNCPHCGASNRAGWPEEAPSGCFGPRAQAVVGYLTGRLGLSHRDVTEAMEALHGLRPGLGSVSAIQDQVSKALEQPVKTAQQYVHQQPVNHVDETGWPECAKQKWLARPVIRRRRGGRARTCSNTRSRCGPLCGRKEWSRPITTPRGFCGVQYCGGGSHSERRVQAGADSWSGF
jgi:uncharacterized protein DUF6444/transposase IS66-like protein